jgi:hypothetical protein
LSFLLELDFPSWLFDADLCLALLLLLGVEISFIDEFISRLGVAGLIMLDDLSRLKSSEKPKLLFFIGLFLSFHPEDFGVPKDFSVNELMDDLLPFMPDSLDVCILPALFMIELSWETNELDEIWFIRPI